MPYFNESDDKYERIGKVIRDAFSAFIVLTLIAPLRPACWFAEMARLASVGGLFRHFKLQARCLLMACAVIKAAPSSGCKPPPGNRSSRKQSEQSRR
jgi:hypothetical protein